MKRRSIAIVLALAGLVCWNVPQSALAATIEIKGQPIELQTPQPRVGIPGVSFTDPVPVDTGSGDQTLIDIPYISQYLAALYKYAVSIAGVIAVIMFVVAGFEWATSGGSADAISTAKNRMTNATIGLVLVMGSYVILYTINPDLVKFKNLKIDYVQTQDLGYQTGGDTETDGSGKVFSVNDPTITQDITSAGITCPKSGGAGAIYSIATSLEHKMSYRMGGKGGPPPYKESGEYIGYNNSCPSGNLCFDCSGLINFIYSCAGLASPGGSTATIFESGSTKITNKDIVYSSNIVKGKPLEPGDLIGWKPSDNSDGSGHVIMFIGNGKVVESFGGKSGRKQNANPRIKNFSEFEGLSGYDFKWIKKAP